MRTIEECASMVPPFPFCPVSKLAERRRWSLPLKPSTTGIIRGASDGPHFEACRIRARLEKGNKVWFVAKDIAEALGYTWSANVIKHVPEEWRGDESVSSPSGTKATLLISEEGLNFFLSRSDKPKALPLQKWIASELLPTTPKTGGSLPTKADDTEADILARHR
jgi:prophage antirepressor-like protein